MERFPRINIIGDYKRAPSILVIDANSWPLICSVLAVGFFRLALVNPAESENLPIHRGVDQRLLVGRERENLPR